jgi:hypothetical protein
MVFPPKRYRFGFSLIPKAEEFPPSSILNPPSSTFQG